MKHLYTLFSIDILFSVFVYTYTYILPNRGFTYSTGAADTVLKEDSVPSKPAGIEFAS